VLYCQFVTQIHNYNNRHYHVRHGFHPEWYTPKHATLKVRMGQADQTYWVLLVYRTDGMNGELTELRELTYGERSELDEYHPVVSVL